MARLLAALLLAVQSSSAFRYHVGSNRALGRPLYHNSLRSTVALQQPQHDESSNVNSSPDVFRRKSIAPVYPKLTAKLQQRKRFNTRTQQAISTLLRVALPTAIATIVGFVYFDNLSLYIRSTLDIGTIRILQADDAQFIQNFLTVIGLLFSILAGNAYSALYQQQESIYFALFQEVSEAKSLLEQTTLVCQGRPFYQSALQCIRDYVKNDLRRLDLPPAELLSTRPMEDPLESIMYMTSVGVPSIVYETVKNLRQARGVRLGAMQRKFPFLGIGLLYLLAMVELLAFPLLGAGTANINGVLSLQSFLFACLCGAHMLVLRIIQELWQSSGGVFNVDEVLQQMVFGLEEELELRAAQAASTGTWGAGGYGARAGGASSASSTLRQQQLRQGSGNESATTNGKRQPWRSPAAELRKEVDAAAAAPLNYDALSPMPYPAPPLELGVNGAGVQPSAPMGTDALADVLADGSLTGDEAKESVLGGSSASAAAVDGTPRSAEAPVPLLPRPQRAFFGRVRRAMMEGIQVIGKSP